MTQAAIIRAIEAALGVPRDGEIFKIRRAS